jgi:hypothetical protein
MVIDITSWHYRWYAYWLREGRGIVPGYRENLCHYVQVLLFWAPATWLDQHTPLGRIPVGGIYTGFLLVATAGGILYMLGWLIYFFVTDPMRGLLYLGIGVGVLVGMLLFAVILVIGGSILIDGKRPAIPGTVKLVGAYVMAKKRRVCPFLTFAEAPTDAHTS